MVRAPRYNILNTCLPFYVYFGAVAGGEHGGICDGAMLAQIGQMRPSPRHIKRHGFTQRKRGGFMIQPKDTQRRFHSGTMWYLKVTMGLCAIWGLAACSGQGSVRPTLSEGHSQTLALNSADMALIWEIEQTYPPGLGAMPQLTSAGFKTAARALDIYADIAAADPENIYAGMRAVELALLVQDPEKSAKNYKRYRENALQYGNAQTRVQAWYYGLLVGFNALDAALISESYTGWQTALNIAPKTPRGRFGAYPAYNARHLTYWVDTMPYATSRTISLIDTVYQQSTAAFWVDVMAEVAKDTMSDYADLVGERATAHPEAVRAQWIMTHYYLGQQAMEKALPYMRRLLDLTAEGTGQNAEQRLMMEAKARQVIAVDALQQGHMADALTHINWLIVHNTPYTMWANYQMGQWLYYQNRYQKAVPFLQAVDATFPQFDFALYHLVASQQALGEITPALANMERLFNHWKQQARIEPNLYNSAIYTFADLYVRNDEAPRAVALIETYLKTYPRTVQLQYVFSLALSEVGEFAAMERELRDILRQEPDHYQALNALGYTMVDKLGRAEEAMPLLERANALSPNNVMILDSIGWAFYYLGNLEQARIYLEQAYAIIADPEIAAHLGQVLWDLGEQERARAILKKALETYPNSKPLRAIAAPLLGIE